MFQQGHTDLWVWWGVWRMGLLALSNLVSIYNLKLMPNLLMVAGFVISSKFLFSTFLTASPSKNAFFLQFVPVYHCIHISSLKSYIRMVVEGGLNTTDFKSRFFKLEDFCSSPRRSIMV